MRCLWSHFSILIFLFMAKVHNLKRTMLAKAVRHFCWATTCFAAAYPASTKDCLSVPAVFVLPFARRSDRCIHVTVSLVVFT